MKPTGYWIILAVVCNAGAQIALKAGAGVDLARWQNWLSPLILLGLGLYGLSFILTVRIYALFPLGIVSPLMTGAIFLLINIAAVVFFSEPITLQKVGGIALIVAGIGLLSHVA